MPPTSRLYDALSQFLSQCQPRWQDARHLQTLCWMMVGLIESQKVHLNGFGVYVNSRATFAQSHQRRFRRWLSNRRIDVMSAHHDLIRQALSQWSKERLYLSLDTTMVWNCFCIVWVGVVYRGRTVPVAWRVVAQSSSTVRLWTIQRVLRQAAGVMPPGVEVVLLADRGFADGKLMKYLKATRLLAFPYPHQAQLLLRASGSVALCARHQACLGASLVRTIRALGQDQVLWHGASSLCPRPAK